jgi:hypothetical protein
MAADLIYGRSFELREVPALRGGTTVDLIPIDGGAEAIAWSSVREVENIAATLGISPSAWPFYPECESPVFAPLEDVKRRCDALRPLLRQMDLSQIQNEWLTFLADILRQDMMFFVVI